MPPVLGVIGRPDCGKTILLEKLIPVLKKKGLRIGTIKHHHGDIHMDTPGKDTWRHKQAGAQAVVLSSPTGIGFIQDTTEDTPLEILISRFFQDVDLVFTEGFKGSTFPKIEVYRSTNHKNPLPDPGEMLIATVSDVEIRPGLPCFGHDDIESLVHFIMNRLHIAPGWESE
jgi:molybdopterin-guanine dinucleotide biosynthesis protein B